MNIENAKQYRHLIMEIAMLEDNIKELTAKYDKPVFEEPLADLVSLLEDRKEKCQKECNDQQNSSRDKLPEHHLPRRSRKRKCQFKNTQTAFFRPHRHCQCRNNQQKQPGHPVKKQCQVRLSGSKNPTGNKSTER